MRILYIVLFLWGSFFFGTRYCIGEGLDLDVKLLIHADNVGNNNFVDSSYDNRTMSVVGGTVGTSSVKKFGSGSAYFDGSSDSLRAVYSGIGAIGSFFTIDMWVYFKDFGEGLLLGQRYDVNNLWNFFYHQTEGLKFQQIVSGSFLTQIERAWTPSLDTWYHLACVNDGGNYGIYVDGNLLGSIEYDGSVVGNNMGTYVEIGDSQNMGDFKGYMDEIRFSVGVARWTSNFTPPVAPYDDVVPTPTPTPTLTPTPTPVLTPTPCGVLEATDEQSYRLLMSLSGCLCGVVMAFGIILAFKRV